jgi:putative ABC transport system permease protein
MFIKVFFRVFYESFILAFQQLLANKLRTFLSLLGIVIGIWCVIMVLSAVNSLEYSIRSSFKKLGDNVIYVSTMPWGEDPRENFWKYMRRPEASYLDFLSIKKNCKSAEIASFNVFIGNAATESTTGNASGVFYIGVTEDYKEMFGLNFQFGRYFSDNEFYHGTNEAVIGYEVYKALFKEGEDPSGKKIKAKGQKLTVIGVLKKEGKDLINPINFDNVVIIPYNAARKYVNLSNSEFNRGRTSISVKAKPDVSVKQLEDELTGVLRSSRKLKPKEESNFALNTLSIISNLLGSVFGVINIAGLFIGGFAIFVGMFSVANIMFVSVKERTNIIGIKKALGAKKYVILIEFLVESVVLCLIGGIIGIILVYLASLAASAIFEFKIFLSARNFSLGIGLALISGIFAGIIPALSAARMEPVEAMRSK